MEPRTVSQVAPSPVMGNARTAATDAMQGAMSRMREAMNRTPEPPVAIASSQIENVMKRAPQPKAEAPIAAPPMQMRMPEIPPLPMMVAPKPAQEPAAVFVPPQVAAPVVAPVVAPVEAPLTEQDEFVEDAPATVDEGPVAAPTA